MMLALIQVAPTTFFAGDILVSETQNGVLKSCPGMRPFVKRDGLSGLSASTLTQNHDQFGHRATELEFLTIADRQLFIAEVEQVWNLEYIEICDGEDRVFELPGMKSRVRSVSYQRI
ncbi:hypothetical protein EC968_008997 [Mortierella alpina]|nr:hypothetical protein EC968_008997 [Mortierella alpina]